MQKNFKKKKTIDEHICSECIKGFMGKDLFTAQVPDRNYTTNYCGKCIKKLKITEYEPYIKVTVRNNIKISDAREWLKSISDSEQNVLCEKYFKGKIISELSTKELKELYKQEK